MKVYIIFLNYPQTANEYLKLYITHTFFLKKELSIYIHIY